MSVIELVVFRAKEGTSRDAVTAAALAITPIIQKMEGYIGREFGATDDGQYADIVRWSSMDNAKKAAEAVMQIPACGAFFSLIEESTMQFLHLHAAGARS